ncbi:GNAT family N-acetyltransferase [Lysobacter panacisoli]|uniref:GNAT family N-acetyltransferase n=1 Tax=Lysobacter panacisoli TaxID=1255263 RepID=A0ABP9KY67_9GAMM|nr:GNAT family N-acetyltransferase [Lysobacter panacisoli]
MSFALHPAQAGDHARILALNLESEEMLSPMDAARLRELDAQSAYHRVVVEGDEVVAFLLAFREGAAYDSPNYVWFAQRYPRFLYIDRVVVASTHQGRKLGAMLYRDLFDFARAHGVGVVTCEYYTQPPNEASRRFHAGFGFREVGSQWVADGRKQVSLQVADA